MEWIVIATNRKAEIYRVTKLNRLAIMVVYKNPLAWVKNSAMRTDRPGESRAKYFGSAPHLLESRQVPQQGAVDQYVLGLCKYLEKKLKRKDSLTLKIVAEPKLLGKIKARLKGTFIDPRIKWIGKGLGKVPKYKWPEIIGVKKAKRPENISNRFPI